MEELNGLTKGHSPARPGNGKPKMSSGRRSSGRASRGLRSWFFNTIARILIWYAIITIVFRCPSSLDECDDTSPALCSAYFNARDTIIPHVEPYYVTYAAPYVDKARPYVNTVSTKIVAPTRVILERYAAPKLEQARDFAQARWATTGQPQLDKARSYATEEYEHRVAPHVAQIIEALGPYRDAAQISALETYEDVIRPSYEFVKPYAIAAYDTGCTVTTETIAPSVVFAFNRTYTFLDANVWPHIRAAYVLNVEPQLVRIGERLGRYKGSGNNGPAKKSVPSHSNADSEPSSFVKPSESVKASHATTTTAEAEITTTSTATSEYLSEADASAGSSSASQSEVEAPQKEIPPGASPEEKRQIASEIVADDLHQWETKFANAADEGAMEIEEKVNELAGAMFNTRVQRTGQKLLQQLESVVDGEIEKLQLGIISIVESSPTDADSAKEATSAAVRAAGLAIKKKAEEIRAWREDFERDLQTTVTAAAQEHFNILGNMRDLALQKLGMKWAWMDGVTYKDWAKYHDMKKRFDQWTQELQELIVTNPSLTNALDGAADLEDSAMELAQGAAMRLALLKQTAAYKIDAGDATDNFDVEEMERAAEEAAQAKAAATDSAPRTEAVGAEDIEQETPIEEEPVVSEGSSTEDDVDSNADSAPEVVPEPVPEPGLEERDGTDSGAAQEMHDEEAASPPELAEADLDADEQAEEPLVEEAGKTTGSEAFPAGGDAPANEEELADDSSVSESAEPETEPPSVDEGDKEAEPITPEEETAEADSEQESADEVPVAKEKPVHVILGAAAEAVPLENAPEGVADAMADSSTDAEPLATEDVSGDSDEDHVAVSAEPEVSTSVEPAEPLLSSVAEAVKSGVEVEDEKSAVDGEADATSAEEAVESKVADEEDAPVEEEAMESAVADKEDTPAEEAVDSSVADEEDTPMEAEDPALPINEEEAAVVNEPETDAPEAEALVDAQDTDDGEGDRLLSRDGPATAGTTGRDEL